MANQEIAHLEIHAHEGRLLPKQYLNLVRSRWMRSYRHCNEYIELIDSQAYYSAYSVYVMHILNRPNAIVRLAVLGDDEDVVLGFSVMENEVLHYVEVPKVYRKQGIGRNLVPGEVKWFSHLTKIGMRLWATKAPHAKLNPFAVLFLILWIAQS